VSEGVVRGERDGHVLRIEVARADEGNGFTPELFDTLSEQLTSLDEDLDLRSKDFAEGVASFVEKRESRFTGE
jgi:enoyl-CoA hydratase/carnithine racemase